MREEMAANWIRALALVCGIGGLAMFLAFPLGSLGLVRVGATDGGILWWDGLLSLAFFAQHSGMVRRQFRGRIYGSISPRYHRALYSIASGVALTAVALLWQRSRVQVWTLDGGWEWATRALAIAALGLFGWGAVAMRDSDLFGVRAVTAGEKEAAPAFVVRGPYRWVRHPFYLAVILLFWSAADVTADRLLFNVLWTAWVWLGTKLEESDLVRDFGPVYEGYRRQVPMLIPRRRPNA
jgi:protein-S-isoprenylcysteine O-methyltransferase Ste14